MKKRLVGTYHLGPSNIRLYVTDADSGASVVGRPKDGGCLEMMIGVKGALWDYCVASLLHEALEHEMHREGCGWKRTFDWTDATDSYLFVMSHVIFDKCVASCSIFMVACMSDFQLAWKAMNAKARPVRRKRKRGRGKEVEK